MNRKQTAAYNERQAQKRAKLMTLIAAYARASEADSWKGGGDPADVPLIEAELQVAELKLSRFVDGIFPNEPMPGEA